MHSARLQRRDWQWRRYSGEDDQCSFDCSGCQQTRTAAQIVFAKSVAADIHPFMLQCLCLLQAMLYNQQGEAK